MLEAVARYETETLVRRSKGETDALSTGFCDLDEALTGGFHPSQLIVLAARPGMGKSALALNVASNICKNGGSVVYFSLEMSLTQQLDRLFASIGKHTMNEIKRPGELNSTQWQAIHEQLKQLGKYRFDLDTRGGLTPAAVQSKAMMLQAQRGLDLIIIDHIQLMASDHHYTERTAELAGGRRARRQSSATFRPQRIGLDRTGCRCGDAALAELILHEKRFRPKSKPYSRESTRRTDGRNPALLVSAIR